MTPAPWGRRHPKEYWSGFFRLLFIGLPVMFVVLYGAVQIVALIFLGHTVK